MWGLIVFLVLSMVFNIFKIDVKTAVKNIFAGKPEVDIKIEPEKKLIEKKEKV